MAWLREADAEFGKAVAASPGLRDLANLGFLQLDLVRAYCALGAAAASARRRRAGGVTSSRAGDASSVDDAERRLAAARAALVKRYDAVYESRGVDAARRGRKVPAAFVPLARLLVLECVAARTRTMPLSLFGGDIDYWRNSSLRYLGYANEVGEAFRHQAPAAVKPSYGLALCYVCLLSKAKRS